MKHPTKQGKYAVIMAASLCHVILWMCVGSVLIASTSMGDSVLGFSTIDPTRTRFGLPSPIIRRGVEPITHSSCRRVVWGSAQKDFVLAASQNNDSRSDISNENSEDVNNLESSSSPTSDDYDSLAGPVANSSGYRPIEEWHAETHNAEEHTLDHLRREQTRWRQTFDNWHKDN